MSIEKFAKRAGERMAEGGLPRAVSLDPATVLVLIQIIVEVVALLKACKATRREAASTLKSPGVAGKLLLRRAVANNTPGRGPLSSYRQEIRGALLETGASMTDEEVSELLA